MNDVNSNESNDCHIWLRVKLSREMHRRLKVMAAERSISLQGLTVEIFDGAFRKGVVAKKNEAASVPREVAGPIVQCGRDGTQVTIANLAAGGAYSK